MLRVPRAVVLAEVLLLCASASARAGEVSLDGIDVTYWVSYEDTAGVPDDIRIASPAEDTIVLLGPTVTAGKWCVPVTEGASCTHPTMSIDGAWERSRIDLGGGDDQVALGPAARGTACLHRGDPPAAADQRSRARGPLHLASTRLS